jgi:hypothetical protein
MRGSIAWERNAGSFGEESRTLAAYVGFFPHTLPAAISSSIRGCSARTAHVSGCLPACRITARSMAELLIVHPKASEASRLRRARSSVIAGVNFTDVFSHRISSSKERSANGGKL